MLQKFWLVEMTLLFFFVIFFQCELHALFQILIADHRKITLRRRIRIRIQIIIDKYGYWNWIESYISKKIISFINFFSLIILFVNYLQWHYYIYSTNFSSKCFFGIYLVLIRIETLQFWSSRWWSDGFLYFFSCSIFVIFYILCGLFSHCI